ncbi:MAG: hypothetical protein WKF71_02235 [Pyrinomonadaceae bacterium]
MFSRKNTINSRSLLTIFAVLVTVLWCGANTITTNAQTVRKNVPLDFTGDGRTDWATIANSLNPAPLGATLRWKVTGNPAPAGPNQAFIREFDYGVRGNAIVPRDYVGDRKTDVAVVRFGTPMNLFRRSIPNRNGWNYS